MWWERIDTFFTQSHAGSFIYVFFVLFFVLFVFLFVLLFVFLYFLLFVLFFVLFCFHLKPFFNLHLLPS